ncbi:MAG: hypothetical protein Q9174_002553, partial [Haloplaca sp. 1 TL-2023]
MSRSVVKILRSIILISFAGAFVSAHGSPSYFSLAQLQPIAGLSDACTQAYNAPLSPCTESDFYEGSSCSVEGTTVFSNTLIGMFFERVAVGKLCSTIMAPTIPIESAGQDPEDQPSDQPAATSRSVESNSANSGSAEPTTQSAAESTSMKSKITTTTTSSTTSSSASSSSATATSTISLDQSSVGPASSGSSSVVVAGGDVPSSTNTPAPPESTGDEGDDGAAEAQNDDEGGGNNNGDGGTVLDAASIAG